MKWYSEENINKIEGFEKELFELYDKYQLAIEHHDVRGAFEISPLTSHNKDWMSYGIDEEINTIKGRLADEELL